MKYLKKYTSFNEEDEFDVSISDTIDVRMSKEELTKMKADIADYNKKKSDIDSIFRNGKTDIEINGKIDALLGKDVSKRNPYLVNYLSAAKGDKDINDIIKGITDDSKIKDLIDISSSTDVNTKKVMQDKISALDKKILDAKALIINKKDEIIKRKKDIDADIASKISNMQNDIKNINKPVK